MGLSHAAYWVSWNITEVIQSAITSSVLVFFDQDGNPELPQVLVQNIFSTYPAFHFSKIYHTMVLFSSRHLSLEDTKWEDGDALTYDKLFERKRDEDKLKNRNTIQEEKERVLYNIDNNIEAGGIRIENLGKCYRKYPFGIKSKQDFQALKSVYLEVGSNELLSILGHNGAGKSTMINVLTGILEPTSGTAYINNYNINEELEDARYHMGVCPQFDILWGELTAYQHLKLFCMLKGINKNQIEDEINRRLSQVELTHVKHAMIKTFSGGMKRRVSLAISALGNPKVIFMDEPTTGMDPKTRRKVWQLIKELKTDRAIILTTHAMEEAEALSDRIAIISQGSLQCIGRSLFLKNNFGDGYRLTIVCKTEHVQQVEKNIKNFMPNGQIVDQSGGSFIITFNQQYMDELNNFLEIIENKQSLNNQEANSFKAQVLDWGISHTTLEEVFMKITNNQS
ncbi:P-loop containing nucleoside triphosphate hydrolase [Pseudocohnilembus persalinus]|uniref:p-loop containing nucleoside triphosphate hydrolase n=1 Tax=Pseudocohnilembus persalinus TaxID=266149 RepID=A0A0V0QIZ7_PSEPJ|nr:P-loop containing nucleoside triphosphate hydrolase [Pseudocohnilembus persalinus]|eukprot:KRX02291.1 P-loop containing nucleoside triphosphate hydrolase [Pseudocohnilembus persalinus]